MNSGKMQKDMALKDKPLPQVSRYPICYWEERRNSSRKNEEAEPKLNNTQLWMYLVVKVNSDAVKNNTA